MSLIAKELRVKEQEILLTRIDLTDLQFLRTPWLWPLVVGSEKDLVGAFRLPGPALKAFESAASELWPGKDDWKEIVRLFSGICTLHVNLRELQTPQRLVDVLRPLVQDAYSKIRAANAKMMTQDAGSNYLLACSLNPNYFGIGEEASVKKAFVRNQRFHENIPHVNNNGSAQSHSKKEACMQIL